MKKSLKKIVIGCLGLLLVCGIASCGKKYDIESAADQLFQMEKNNSNSTASYELVGQIDVEGEYYPVTWSIEVVSGDESCITLGTESEHMVPVTVIREIGKPATEVNYKLKYVITTPNGKTTKEGSFDRKVPLFNYATFADLKANAKSDVSDTSYDWVGIVTDKSTFNTGKCNVWLQDANGGLEGYGVNLDQETYDKISIGSEICLSGKIKDYYGMIEFDGNPTVKVLKETGTVPTTNIDEAFKNAEDNKDAEEFGKYMCMETTVTGAKIISEGKASDGYYWFEKEGVRSYFRPSSSSSYLFSDDTTTGDFAVLDSLWHYGHTVTLTGIVQSYSGVYYLMPAKVEANSDRYIKVTSTELSDVDKVAGAIEEVKELFALSYASDPELELPTESSDYAGVSFEYALEDNDDGLVAISDTNVLSINCTKEEIVKLKVTATKGEATKTETIDLNIVIPEPITIAKFLEDKDTENVQYLQGYVVATGSGHTYTVKEAFDSYAVGDTLKLAQYKALSAENKAKVETAPTKDSFVIADATGAVFSYNKFALEVGDEVIISTKYAVNNGTAQSGTISLIKTISKGNDYTGELKNEYNSSDIEGFITASTSTSAVEGLTGKLVKVTAILKKSGNYYSLYKNAADSDNIVSLKFNEEIQAKFDELLGTNTSIEVDTYGYNRGCSNKYYTMQVVDVVAKGTTYVAKGIPVILTVNNAFSGDTGYLTEAKTFKCNDVEVELSKNAAYSYGPYFQLKKSEGKITVKNITPKQVTVKILVKGDYPTGTKAPTFKFGTTDVNPIETAQQISDNKITDSGIKLYYSDTVNASLYTLTFDVNATAAGDFTVAAGGGATYVHSIAFK